MCVTSLPQGTFDHVWRPPGEDVAPDTQWVEAQECCSTSLQGIGEPITEVHVVRVSQYQAAEALPAPVGISFCGFDRRSPLAVEFHLRALDEKTECLQLADLSVKKDALMMLDFTMLLVFSFLCGVLLSVCVHACPLVSNSLRPHGL